MAIVLLAHSCSASVNICRNGSSFNDTVQDSKTYLMAHVLSLRDKMDEFQP